MIKFSTQWDPSEKKYDAAIFGGGYAGMSAALELRAQRKKVIIIERRGTLGWETVTAFQADLRESDTRLSSELGRRLGDNLSG